MIFSKTTPNTTITITTMRLKFLITLAFLAVSFGSFGQLLQWNTFGNAGTETTEPSVFNNANISSSTLTQGTITPAANANRFGGSNWFNTGNTVGGNTLAEAVAGNDYIQFVVTPNFGFSFTATSFVFSWDRSGTGPQNVTLRSSVDGFAADLGTVAPVAAVGTFNTITIIGVSNVTTATTFRLYGYGATATGGTGGFDVATNVVNVQLNGTTASSGPFSVMSGDWNTPATWSTNLVPTSTDNVTISTGNVVSTATALTRTGTTIVNGTFELQTGGDATGTNFNYNSSTGSLNFNTAAMTTVTATSVYWPASNSPFNVNVFSGGITMNAGSNRTVAGNFTTAATVTLTSTLTFNGIVQLNTGGNFSSLTFPIYTSNSTLIYNTGGSISVGFEWPGNGTTAGSGIPQNITIQNNTTLSMATTARGLAGDLTLLNGNLILNPVSGNLNLAGNWTKAAAAVFTPNGRTVNFNKPSAATQIITVTGGGTQTFDYLTLATNNILQLAPTTDVIITALNGGTAITLNAANVFDLNGNTLTIGTTAVANSIAGTGTFKGSTTSNLTLLGTGSVGSLNFTTGFENLGAFIMNRTAAAIGCVLGTTLTVNTTLTLTAGLIDLGNNFMTFSAAATTTGGSANSFVIADVANGIGAEVRKTFSVAGSFTYPIGDRAASANGSQYSPATLTFTGGSYGGYAGVAVDDLKEPNLDATTDFITRYWSISNSGISPTSYSVSANYYATDVNGTETNCRSNQWNGTTLAWSNGGSTAGTNTLSIGGITALPAVNHITKGYRNPEINIKQGIDYLHTSTYTFAAAVTGTNNDIVFTIQNLGQQNLTLGAATITGNPVFTLFSNYTTPVTGPSGTTTFTIRFAPSAAGTFLGSISIPNNDPSGLENPYVINFSGTATVPASEINLKGFTGGTNSIPSGNTTISGLDNTSFGTIALGGNSTKDFEIQNTGTAVLNLTGTPKVNIVGTNPGDFTVTTVPATGAIATASSTTFIITFAPLAAGIRTATVSIANNDTTGGENPYTYNIQGSGTCATATNTITPTSGPVGTEIIINATANNLTGATATFNGVSGTVTAVSATQIKVTVPSGAISGILTTTNGQGCQASNPFTVINNAGNTCQGGVVATDLFISEVTDASSGGLTYVEIYNGTGAAVNLSGYSVKIANNASASYGPPLLLSSVSLANGATYVVSFGSDGSCTVPGGNGSYAAQGAGGGINFNPGANDHIALFKGAALLDSFGVYTSATWADALGLSTNGATFRRKNTVIAPSTIYANANWNIIDWPGTGVTSCSTNDYSDIGTYNFLSGTPPTVTVQPSYTPSCKATTLTVAGTEGFSGGSVLAYQWFGVAPNVATWTSLTNAGVYSGVTTPILSIANLTGLDGYQYYCQIRESSATCYTASNPVKIIEAQTTTWNGTIWSPVSPTIGSIVIINGNYDTAINGGSFEACSVTVNSTKTLTINATQYVSIQNDLTVNGSLVIENQGSLIMIDDNGVVTNTGNTQVKKTTTPYEKYDYTYWSSPVANNTIGATFSAWRTDYSFSFITPNFVDILTAATSLAPSDGFDDAAPYAWTNTGTAAVMTPAKGYAIMAPTAGIFPTTSSVVFSGAVNTGNISIALALSGNGADPNDDFNLIGNPYPSAVNATKFINDNTNFAGTLYFWTHVGNISSSNPGPNAYNFITDDYALFNLTGGTRGSLTAPTSPVPSGFIASGQGFFIEANTATSINFTNAMRNKTYINTNFYRNPSQNHLVVAPPTADRIWLNMTNQEGLFSQQLIGYFDQATAGIDRGYDGLALKSQNSASFYSVLESEQYRIQGRATFDANDLVALGFFSAFPGTFNISIDQVEGQLDASPVYLEDKLLHIIHDLKQAPYSFATTAGRYDSRFVLRYTNQNLATANFENSTNNVVIVSGQQQIKIKSYLDPIDTVTVYDILGREIAKKSTISNNEFVVLGLVSSQQALVVKILLENGQTVTKKIIF